MNKICTSIKQSKKLIELGIDRTTADMYYSFDYNIDEYEDDAQIIPQSELGQHFSLFPEDIPCWSLAALLGVLPKGTNISTPKPIDELSYCCWNQYDEIYAVNPIDACYEMIIRLNELKLL